MAEKLLLDKPIQCEWGVFTPSLLCLEQGIADDLDECMSARGWKHSQEPSLKVLSSAYQKSHLLEMQSAKAALVRSSEETLLYAIAMFFWKTVAEEFVLVKMTTFHLHMASVDFVKCLPLC